MAAKTSNAVEKIKDFTSLADHDAGTVREGNVTRLKFGGYTVRRIIYNGEPLYSVVDSVGALTENTNARKASDYWAQTKKRMIEKEGAAYDIATHRDAPPGMRIWCGCTVERSDVAALTPWIDWAFEQTKAALPKAA